MKFLELDEWEEEYESGDDRGILPEPPICEDFIFLQKKQRELPEHTIHLRPSQFTEFAMRMPNAETGAYGSFSFEGRRHMRKPYDSVARRMLLQAARQVEKSTLCGNLGLSYCCIIPSYKVLYVSPSAMQTKTFSADRLKEPMDTSDVLTAFTTGMLAKNIFEKQFVNRSKITLRYSYLSADRTRGGHLLDCRIEKGSAAVDETLNLEVALLNRSDFLELDLSGDKSEELKKVE
jgi:hypothetical protein